MAALTPWAFVLPSLLIGALLAYGLARQHARTRDELRRAREELKRLNDQLDVWQWRTDTAHCLSLLRAPAGAAPGAPLAAGVPLAERIVFPAAEALRQQLAAHAPLHDLEGRFAPAAEQPARRVLLRGAPVSDDAGRVAGYAGTLRILEEAVPAPADADAEAERESFSYTVSHDLRAPIRVVEGFTRILKEDYGASLDRIANDHLDRVLGAAARMNAMIDALLALSKLSSQPITRQPVNLSQLAAYVAEDLRRQSPGREITLHIEPGLQVMGDPTLLRLVLENLLGNAWKYTAKTRAAEVWLERRAQHHDTYTVRYNGAGFEMAYAGKLFQPFQRLTRTGCTCSAGRAPSMASLGRRSVHA